MNRRKFLSGSAGLLALGSFPGILRAANPWGTLPASVTGLEEYNILEVFLPGGCSQWENLWVSHDGNNGDKNWRGLDDFVSNLNWSNCPGAPNSSTSTQLFGHDNSAGNNTPISWGPATAPLWRDDIFNRCRMVITQHTDDLHQFAGYRTLTGRRFGSPRGASLGAAIQRYHQGQPDPLSIPYAYALAPDHLGRQYFMNQAVALGQHPGSARPLGLKVGNAIGDLLARSDVSSEADAVFENIRSQYQDLLRWQGSGNTVRAADFSVYDSAAAYLTNAQELDDILGGNTLLAGTVSPCAYADGHNFGSVSNTSLRSVKVAAKLFAEGAKHITLIDGGLSIGGLRDSSTPYDGHHRSGNKNVVEMTSVHLFNMLKSLADSIALPANGNGGGNGGGFVQANDWPKIDLNKTMIVLHTEFNRTPSINPEKHIDTSGDFDSCGRDHFAHATVALLIGGPVTSRGISGGIRQDGDDLNSAVAVNPFTPTDIHAAALMAAGVDPLAPGNFTVGDEFSAQVNPGGVYDQEIYNNLKHKVLGVSNGLGSYKSL